MRAQKPFAQSLRVLGFLAATTFVACSTPVPPTLTPKQATVKSITAQGIDLVVDIEATNPNSFALSARNVTGHATLDGKYDLGNVTLATAIDLPANGTATISAPLSVKWSDASALVSMGLTNRPIPYEIVGTVNIGGGKINVDLPYTVKGAIKHDDIVQATMQSLPSMPGMMRPTMR